MVDPKELQATSTTSSSVVSEKENISLKNKDDKVKVVNESSQVSVESKHSGEYKIITSKDADATFTFMEENDASVPEITPEQEKRLRRKVAWVIVSLTATIDFLLYSDKATLSYASIFELWDDTHLTQNRYNNANTLFYVGYIIGLVNLIWVQKFSIRKVMAFMCTTSVSYTHLDVYKRQHSIS